MNQQFPTLIRPAWAPIGQYRTIPLPILPIPPHMKRIPYPRIKAPAKENKLTQ